MDFKKINYLFLRLSYESVIFVIDNNLDFTKLSFKKFVCDLPPSQSLIN